MNKGKPGQADAPYFVDVPGPHPDPLPQAGEGAHSRHLTDATVFSGTDGSLPSPACGRGAGGEGERIPKPEFARTLRARQTDAEQRLWYQFRDRRFMGLKFKRQHQLGPFIADFVCLEARLIIEADGGQHESSVDAGRDAWFRREGYRVLRFWNHDILGNLEAVLESIRQVVLGLGFLDAPALTPDPSPASGRGEKTGGKRVL